MSYSDFNTSLNNIKVGKNKICIVHLWQASADLIIIDVENMPKNFSMLLDMQK